MVCNFNYKVVYEQKKIFNRHLQLFYMHLSVKLYWPNPRALIIAPGTFTLKSCEKRIHITQFEEDPWFSRNHCIHHIFEDGEGTVSRDQGCFVGSPSCLSTMLCRGYSQEMMVRLWLWLGSGCWWSRGAPEGQCHCLHSQWRTCGLFL